MAAQPVSIQQQMIYLLERPREPFFVPKGEKGAVFDPPSDEFLVERFRPLAEDLETRFGGRANVRIPVAKITQPDYSFPLQLGRYDNFSLFIPYHREMATRLIEIFMGMRTFDDFKAASVYCRDRINPYMYIYAMSVAILHRPDTKEVDLPPLSEIFPDKFLDAGVFTEAAEEASALSQESREPIVLERDRTATDLDIENRIAYFREDIGINLHHWHWHLVFPFNGPRAIVNKDRRGEFFYYMHQQIQARYNFERLCNKLARVKRLHDLRETIIEGYFPKLDNKVASRIWASRPSGTKLKDVRREVDQLAFDIQDLERWRDRIIEAIHVGQVINDKGETVDLTEQGGIDVLGNILEASILSINRNLYGDLHNLAHAALGIIHDPDFRFLETYSPVADPSTAMRDPVFYRLHAFVDYLFQLHKNTLPRYTAEQLDFKGIKVTGIEINTKGRKPNEMETFWQQKDVDLSRGLDFAPRGPVFVRFTHLQHSEFSYKIQVENNTNGTARGTVRIFLAPKLDERRQAMPFSDQRIYFIEQDKFTVEIKDKVSTIERPSSKSTITIPWERTFRDLENDTPSAENVRASYCGCGWPEHMLIPKGDAAGFPCDVFVMISNSQDDLVEQPLRSLDASSYCGLRDKKYPDKRSMGYPFDRMPRNGVNTLQEFLTPNMKTAEVKIYHNDRTEAPPPARK